MSAIGYFTAEIGLWSDLHTYSGGLGVLAGDHVKSAADAEIPLIGVTLLYREGYSRQHLDSDGVQSETYPVLDPSEFLEETAITIEIPLDNQTIYARVWRANIVGQTGHKVPVYFLDTTHENNSQYHQEIGQRLYGGDDDTRIRLSLIHI